MSSYRCMRLACQSKALPAFPRCSPAQRLGHFLARSQYSSEATAGRFAHQSGPEANASEYHGQDAQDGEMSAFKQQRLVDLARAREGESPLISESYPRLKSNPNKMSNAEFRRRFTELEQTKRSQSSGQEAPQALASTSFASSDASPVQSKDNPDRKPTDEEFKEVYQEAEREATLLRATLTGRVRAKRVVGSGLVFVDIVNDFQKVQVMINKKKCLATEHRQVFKMWRNLIQVGDHISVTGTSRLTDAGELTLEAESLPQLLSPTLEQIPDKLSDSKTKREERHLDMLVNKQTTDVLRLRAAITKHLRDHFHSNQFLEMQTPILADNAGGAIARPFKTRATEFSEKELALRIAPELWLKRLVVGGIDKVFEIGPAFRNEGIDGTHNPEFTTCEFYSAYSNLAELIQQTEHIMFGIASECQKLISTDLTALPEIDVEMFRGPYKQVEFLPGLEEAIGIRFPNLSAEGALPELIAVLKLAGVDLGGDTPRSLHKLLDRLGAIYLEPMSFDEPIFITNHPACMSPLAKGFLCPKTYQLVSARAELFVGGRELANMYEEENDPAEQSRKMNAHRRLVNKPGGDIALRPENTQDLEEFEEVDEEIPPVDQAFLRSLEYGLPPTGGWGCGVERLVMLFSGTDRISDCLSFGTLRNVVNRNN
ncbi:hypothetical protein NLU13_8137 [Sarocladium strictum]|uniref:Lysyl-tRNA synthetase n=1 Tax=Sarocladium strictum TaxID=5046 RepID=A0AA39L4P3_SARSR|nr:hypothetical protein NLU13_8137 [Sarocladium strictum]